MERIKELEKELEKVCGKYENDCSKCPKQAECEEYCKLEQEEEEEEPQKPGDYKVGYRIDEDAAHGIKQGYRIIAAFDYVVNAQDFIEKCIPAENQDRFFMLSNNTRYYPTTGNFEIF